MQFNNFWVCQKFWAIDCEHLFSLFELIRLNLDAFCKVFFLNFFIFILIVNGGNGGRLGCRQGAKKLWAPQCELAVFQLIALANQFE